MRGGAEVVREDRVLAVDPLPGEAPVAAVESAGELQPPVPAPRRLEQVARDEPENLEAWAVLYVGALAIDRKPLARRSLRTIGELDPQLGERLRGGPAPGS